MLNCDNFSFEIKLSSDGTLQHTVVEDLYGDVDGRKEKGEGD